MLKMKIRLKNCDHAVTEVSQIAGLLRSTCLKCGHVSFHYKEEAVSPRTAIIQAKLTDAERSER